MNMKSNFNANENGIVEISFVRTSHMYNSNITGAISSLSLIIKCRIFLAKISDSVPGEQKLGECDENNWSRVHLPVEYCSSSQSGRCAHRFPNKLQNVMQKANRRGEKVRNAPESNKLTICSRVHAKCGERGSVRGRRLLFCTSI